MTTLTKSEVVEVFEYSMVLIWRRSAQARQSALEGYKFGMIDFEGDVAYPDLYEDLHFLMRISDKLALNNE